MLCVTESRRTDLNKEHSHLHNHPHNHPHHHGPWWKRLHRDWRAWAVVLLMLAAMAAYVLSSNEALRPGGGRQQPMPAAHRPVRRFLYGLGKALRDDQQNRGPHAQVALLPAFAVENVSGGPATVLITLRRDGFPSRRSVMSTNGKSTMRDHLQAIITVLTLINPLMCATIIGPPQRLGRRPRRCGDIPC